MRKLLSPEPPQVPTGLKVDSVTKTTANISWSPVEYDGGIKEYQILRNGKEIGESSVATYKDTGLTADTEYSYQVIAVGNNSLVSEKSEELKVKTEASASS